MDVDRHPHGMPSWTDLLVPDVPAAVEFYGGLFGWETESDPAAPGVVMCTRRGRPVAAIIAQPPGYDRPPRWNPYLTVDDADATAERVSAALGTVLEPPFDIGEVGRTAPIVDTEGAELAIWQPYNHHGTGILDEHGTLRWIQLDDASKGERAKAFYRDVFGWVADDDAYVTFTLGERPIAGMAEPSDGPASWTVYFNVDDVDASAARFEELGGQVRYRSDSPVFAYGIDPQGARLALLEIW